MNRCPSFPAIQLNLTRFVLEALIDLRGLSGRPFRLGGRHRTIPHPGVVGEIAYSIRHEDIASLSPLMLVKSGVSEVRTQEVPPKLSF